MDMGKKQKYEQANQSSIVAQCDYYAFFENACGGKQWGFVWQNDRK